jgi:hypothetical protein
LCKGLKIWYNEQGLANTAFRKRPEISSANYCFAIEDKCFCSSLFSDDGIVADKQ